MIKAGITEAESALAGELIRILLNHPDVEIVTAFSPVNSGISLHALHHGLIGETNLNFSDRMNPDELDIVFICGNSDFSSSLIENRNHFPELRIVDLSYSGQTSQAEDFALGISEINRKQLVRGAKRVYILPPAVTILSVGLFPLAFNLLLNSNLNIDIQIPNALSKSFNAEKEAALTAELFQKIQKSFSSRVSFNVTGSPSRRGARLTLDIPVSSDIENILSLYENLYDDHNFIFTSGKKLELREVVGTHKVLVTLHKTDDRMLHIEIIADYLMRGAAGEAVHALNLLFGLHERTGLALKASSV